MKHLKLFNDTASYEVWKNSEGYVLPNVSYVVETENVSYEPYVDLTANYLTIEALEDGLTVVLKKKDTTIRNYEYCVDGDGNWKKVTYDNPVESINTGHTLSFRGELIPENRYSYGYGIGTFTISKRCNLKGNCMSMLFGDNAANNYSLSDKEYAFYKLFSNCSNIINISNNFLPATTLSEVCYEYMFYNCTSLTTAPELPATTLTEDCYGSMFRKCTSLTTAPDLPATTLANRCYQNMFDTCTSLTTAPYLPATTLSPSCYDNMFNGCSSLTTSPELPATTLAENCYAYMFGGCTSLTTAPYLPATTLSPSCYVDMFSYCNSLTTAPELPATTLTEMCYSGMFRGCTKLNYIKMLATNILSTVDDCLGYWVYEVASSGTFVKNSAMTNLPTATASNSYSGIPSGWTVQNA